jgi:hypothetical protein
MKNQEQLARELVPQGHRKPPQVKKVWVQRRVHLSLRRAIISAATLLLAFLLHRWHQVACLKQAWEAKS